MSNFSTPERVLGVIRATDDVEAVRSNNRVKVTNASNCVPPFTPEEAKKLGVKINVNWGELKLDLTHATEQLLNAFFGNQYFFTVRLPKAPPDYRADWEAFITDAINRPLRNSLEYFELHRSRWTSVVTHGVGPMVWPHPDRWKPRFQAMADVRIATDTLLDFSNLGWFAIRHNYTVSELIEEAFNDNPNNHWDKKAVRNILKGYKEINTAYALDGYNWETDYEKIASVIQQDGGLGMSSALPTIPLWHFYFEDNTEPGNKGWFMVVVPENAAIKAESNDEFLWKSEKPIADKWQHIIHCQYGDLNSDPPAKYDAIRGLGFILLEPTFYNNITRCRGLQHLHDQFNIWLRSTDPANKARSQIQEFSNLGVVAPGLSIIPANERHQVDAGWFEMMMAQLTQLTQEASSGYTQNTDTGTKKEQTAFETRVKLEQVNAMMGAILRIAFKYEGYAHREICRRFLLKQGQGGTPMQDEDILEFQKACFDYKIDPRFMDIKQWEVEPVSPLGMGNPTMAQAAAEQLMQIRGSLPPKGQDMALHEKVLAITQDPRKANEYAPLAHKPAQSAAKREAIGLFGTLMTGVPVPLEESNLIDQIDALLPLLAGKIVQIEQRDNMAGHAEAVGLMNVGGDKESPNGYIFRAITQLAQDPQQQQKVKQYFDSLGKLMNQVKGIAQRGAEKAQKEAEQASGADREKVQGDLAIKQFKTQADLKLKADKQNHGIALKNQQFQADNTRKNLEAVTAAGREHFKTIHGANMAREKQKQTFNGEE